jgi:hypothetical protein
LIALDDARFLIGVHEMEAPGICPKTIGFEIPEAY